MNENPALRAAEQKAPLETATRLTDNLAGVPAWGWVAAGLLAGKCCSPVQEGTRSACSPRRCRAPASRTGSNSGWVRT